MLRPMSSGIEKHLGMARRRGFGAEIARSPMTPCRLAVFFAGTGESFKEMPRDILARAQDLR